MVVVDDDLAAGGNGLAGQDPSLLDLAGVTGDWFGPNVADYIFQVALTIIGLWYLVELGFLRGTPGDNKYGPEPLANKAA